MKKWLIILFASFNADAAYKVLNITTSIDVSLLYNEKITSVEFIPSVLELAPSQDKTKFEDANTTLKIETDLPIEYSEVPYVSTLNKNTSTCTDISGVSTIQDKFVSLTIDGQNLLEGESVYFSKFNSNDGYNQYSEHDVILSFGLFEEIKTDGQPEHCNGEIEFSIGVDI